MATYDKYKDSIDKSGIQFTPTGSDADSRMLWASNGITGKGSSGKLDPIFSQIGQEIWGQQNNGPRIFKSMNPATWFESNPQKVVEDLMGLKPGQDIFMFDVENIGTFNGKGDKNLPWYSVTELAMSRRRVAKDYTLQRVRDTEDISLLLRPMGEDLRRIDDLIEKAKTGQTLRFTPDERRTLNDLILYGHDDPFNAGYFRMNKRGVTYLDKQLRDKQVPDGFVFNKDQINRMIVGRNNLVKYGATADQTLLELDAMFGNAGNIKLGGYNIDKYDVPLMLDYVNNKLGKHASDPKSRVALERLQKSLETATSLDTFQMVKSLYKDHASQFGRNLKQEQMADVLGIAKGTSHMALDDLNTTAEIHNHLIKNLNTQDKLKLGWNVAQGITSGKMKFGAAWNSTPYNVGQNVFALSGVANSSAGKYDMVYRIDPNKGHFVPAYGDMRPNPLYKNTEYKINRLFTKQINGETMHGTILQNMDDENLFHVIMRKDQNELRNFFQQNLVSSEELLPGDKDQLRRVTAWDRARRRWDRLFSPDGGPDELRSMLNAAQLFQQGADDATLQGALTVRNKKGEVRNLGPSALRDLKEIAPRLNAEGQYINEFLNYLDSTPLSDKGKGVALGHFRKNLDREFGENISEIATGASKVWSTMVDGESHIISLRNSTSIQAGLSRAIRAGHVGAPALTIVKKRMLEMVNQLYVTGPGGLSSTRAQELRGMINALREGDSYNTLLTELAGRVEEAMDYEAGKGLNVIGTNSMWVEDPTGITPNRLEGLTKGWHNKKQSIMARSTSNAMALDKYGWDSEHQIFSSDPMFNKVLSDHDNAMATLAKHTGASGSSLKTVSARETLTRLASAFVDDDLAGAYIWDDKHKGLVLALANKKQAEDIFRLAPNEILESTKVAKIKVGLLQDGKLKLPGQERMANLVIVNNRDKAYLGSTVDKIVNNLVMARSSIKEKILGGEIFSAESQAKNIVSRTAENLMLNTSRMSASDMDEMRRFDERRSSLVTNIRSGFIDMSGFAPEWYKEKYGDSKFNQKMNALGHDRSLTFLDVLNMDERKTINKELSSWARDRYGLRVNTNNVKDVHAMNLIRSAEAVDMRSFTPFGYYTPMARENIMKSASYQALDPATTRANLSKYFDGNTVDRMLTRPLVTDAYQAVAGNELGYLNLRAAYIDSNQLNAMMRQHLGGVDPTASTYEGTILLHEDVAKSIATEREKKIKLADGADLDEKIWKLFGSLGAQADDNGNIMFAQGTSIADRDITRLGLDVNNTVGSSRKGQLTVGKLMRGENIREEYGYHSNADFSYIKGFNRERGELIIGEMYNLQTGDKMISAGGLRVTPIVKSRQWFEQMGIDAQVVVPEMEMKKEQFGSFLNSRVSMVVQEVLDSGKTTVGDLTREQVLGQMMEEYFGVDSKTLNFTGAQVVMSAKQGVESRRSIKLDQLHDFMREASAKFGIKDFTQDTIQYGQEAMAVGDVYRWQNSMGRTFAVDKQSGQILAENTEGLVRWGIKDQGAIASAANNILGRDNQVTKWLDGHVRAVAQAQNSDVERFGKALIRAARDHTDLELANGNLATGEIVIRNQGDAFSPTDVNGRRTARRTANGVTEVSSLAFNPVAPPTQRNQVRTVGDYAKTVVQMGDLDVDIVGANGEVNESFADVLHRNGGTALFELPNNSFGRKYVRFIDSSIAQIALDSEDDMAVLNEIQQSQVRIARLTQEYQTAQDPTKLSKLQGRIWGAVKEHDSNVKKMLESSRPGSISDRLFSAKMDMAGRFTVQTLNPLDSGKYKEASLIVSRDRMAEMINGAESNILETLNKDQYSQLNANWMKSVEGKNLTEVDSLVSKNAFMRETALAEIEQKGLYGFVNRYPTIHESTHQVLNVQIGKDLPTELHNSRTAFLTVGTAVVQNADSDGDFMSTVLAHYKIGDATQRLKLHSEMGQLHAYNEAQHREYADLVRKDVGRVASERGMTVQELWSDPNYRKGFMEEWIPRVGNLSDRETDIARFGKGDVGILDNLRLKLSNMGRSIWTSISAGMGEDIGITDRVAKLDEFGRLVSQKAISSKKFSIASITEQISKERKASGLEMLEGADLEAAIGQRMNQRDEAISMLIQGMQDPNAKGIQNIRRASEVLDIFKLGDMHDDPTRKDGFTRRDQKFTLDSMLDTLEETYDVYGNRKGWLNNIFLRAGVSEGQIDIATTSNMLKGKGDMAIDTPFVRRLMELDEGFDRYMQEPLERFQNSMVSNYKRKKGFDRSFDGLLASTENYMGRDMIDLGANVDTGSKSRITEVAEGFASGLGRGGSIGFKSVQAGMAVFGGLWATSALMRSGPTPESTSRNPVGEIQDIPIKGLLAQPTARITPNDSGEQINIQIASSQASKMNHQQIAAMVQQELSAMMPVQLNMNMNVKDNTQNINQQWLQGIVAQAVSTGRII